MASWRHAKEQFVAEYLCRTQDNKDLAVTAFSSEDDENDVGSRLTPDFRDLCLGQKNTVAKMIG